MRLRLAKIVRNTKYLRRPRALRAPTATLPCIPEPSDPGVWDSNFLEVPEGPVRDARLFEYGLEEFVRAGADLLYVDMNTLTSADGTLILKEFAVACPGAGAVSLLVKAPKSLRSAKGPNSHGIAWNCAPC